MADLVSKNPAKNYQRIGSVKISDIKDIIRKVGFANKAKEVWGELGVSKRIKILKSVYAGFFESRDEFALLITKEVGKPIRESRDEISKGLRYFKHYLEYGEGYLKPDITYKDEKNVNKVIFEPQGVAAVILPWNYPFMLFIWGALPNLIVGNTVVLKHSEETPLVGKFIENIMEKANLPDGVFSEVYGAGKVGELLVNLDVDLIWFTGSTLVGRKLYKVAAKKFIRVVLEMGGSNPAIVFENVDIEKVAETIYVKRFTNCGQYCSAVKRVIVQESIFDKVVELLKKVIESKKVGDPESESTDIGSLVSQKQLDLIGSQVEDAVEKGAKVITGGKPPKGLEGAYFLPTLLTNIKRSMKVWREETFGPVLPIIPFKTEEEAIKLANDSVYGLGAQIFTRDKARALRVASKIKAGFVDINYASHSFPSTPYGGCKASGIGREHGKYGFQELCEIKVLATSRRFQLL